MTPALPARRDAHLHLYAYGRSLEFLDLSGCSGGAEMLDLVADAAARVRARAGTLLIADKARPEAWDPPGWPTPGAIDRVTEGMLFCAWCFDYHALLANAPALALAGLGHASPDPEGGLIGRDAEGGLTGVLYERAAAMLWESLPDPDLTRAGAVLARAIEALRGHSLAEVHDLKAQPWLGPELARLDDEGRLEGFRVELWPLVEDLDAVFATRGRWEREGLRLAGAKIFVDGTLNSRTAWMLHDYADGRGDQPRGLPMMSPAEIRVAVERCDASGLPLAAHAIGDGAVRAVLDAIETVRPATPGFRIEHAELVDGADVPRFARLGVICSVQPCHLLYDIEALRRGVPGRLDRVLPLRSLIDAGCRPGELMMFGSDTPIVRPDPGDSILAAVARRRAEMPAGEAIAPSEAITPDEAEACFRAGTSGAW